MEAHRLVAGALSEDCMTLTQLWMSDALPNNSESKVIGVVQRELRRHTLVKFLIAYADPSRGHLGTIYQAANWSYTGHSQAMPLYDLGDGVARHSRTLGHIFGTHSKKYLRSHGIKVKLVPQSPKHRYIYLLDKSWRGRLKVPALPYPKSEVSDHGDP